VGNDLKKVTVYLRKKEGRKEELISFDVIRRGAGSVSIGACWGKNPQTSRETVKRRTATDFWGRREKRASISQKERGFMEREFAHCRAPQRGEVPPIPLKVILYPVVVGKKGWKR